MDAAGRSSCAPPTAWHRGPSRLFALNGAWPSAKRHAAPARRREPLVCQWLCARGFGHVVRPSRAAGQVYTASMKRALIVIDVQNDYFDGNLPIAYPPPSVSLPNVTAAMDAARTAGVPVVVVESVLAEGAPIFAKGTRGALLHADVAARPRDLLVSKPLPSCLAKTELGAWLAERGVDTLTLVGYMTHNCVDATARQASHEGFAVEVLADATGSPAYANTAGRASAEELHRVFLTALQARFASVLATGDWIALLPATPAPPCSGIWRSVKNARP